MDPDLNADTPSLGAIHVLVQAHVPPILGEPLPRLHDHVPHEFALVHERSAEGLGTGPGLGAAAVEVDALDPGRREGRGTG